jgi:hypothetical protein
MIKLEEMTPRRKLNESGFSLISPGIQRGLIVKLMPM